MTVFLRLLDASVDEKPEALVRAVAFLHDHDRRDDRFQRAVFERQPSAFSAVPGSPFAYWVSEQVRSVFSRNDAFKGGGRVAAVGIQTSDDSRFLRLAWETPSPDFACFAKGGSFSPFYAGVYLRLQWRADGRELKSSVEARYGTASKHVQNQRHYFRPGLTWPLRTTSGFGIRAMPAGCIFGHKGPAVFVDGDSPDQLLALLAITTSAVFCYLIELQLAAADAAARSYEVGVIQRTPVPNLTEADVGALAQLARRAWSLMRLLDTTNETSHAFVLPAGTLGQEASSIHPEAGGFNRADIERELMEIQAEIDDKVFALYGISDRERVTIETSMTRGSVRSLGSDRTDTGSSDDPDESDDSDDEGEATAELTATTLTTYSWLVGVAFGRFDPRLATSLVRAYRTTDGPPYTLLEGRRPIPPEPEPFDPLPVRSPGMWPEGEIPVEVPPDIMVDDAGHDHDIRTLIADAAARTGWPDPEDLRQWLAKEFFPLHIRMYSKSRRKAPIYWQLATPSASYSVWLYIHAFTKDTLFRVQNDYVAPKLAFEEQRLRAVRRDGGFTEETDPTPYETKRIDDAVAEVLGKPRVVSKTSRHSKTSATARKELANQETFVEELRVFLDEVKRVAPLWKPHLDDGVIINFSLLWRLVPQHKPWQKELKATWDALCAGEYDWAHLAMHLWPERVVPKCAKDRSLAIAHGLEEVFWVEASDGKWTARKTPTTPVAELIRERTSPAVEDALERLLKAPGPAGGGTKKKAVRKQAGRKKRSARGDGP